MNWIEDIKSEKSMLLPSYEANKIISFDQKNKSDFG